MTFLSLSVITDAREWRYFKSLSGLTTPVEEHMFNLTGEKPQIFLRPKESVNVPLRYLSLRADHTVDALAPADPYRPFSQTAAFQAYRNKNANQLESREIKVCYAIDILTSGFTSPRLGCMVVA